MSFESFIGLRYLRARRSRSFLSTIAMISIGGVAVGVAALIVVLSVIAGYEAELRDKIIGVNSHGNLMKLTYGFPNYREAMEKIDALPEVLASTPFVLREVMVSSHRRVSGALVKGIDLETAFQVSSLDQKFVSGSKDYLADPERLLEETRLPEGDPAGESRIKRRYGDKVLPGIIIGGELARHLGVKLGDEVNVVNPLGGGMGETGPIPSNQYFRVAAVFELGMYDYDMQFVFTTMEELQRFSNMDATAITALEFRVKPEYVYETGRIGEEIEKAMGGFPYKVRDWRQMNRNLFAALGLQRAAMFIILSFITLVAAFNIASTLIMMVIEKGKEIAILKSMGASRFSIMKIFMLDGLIIGGIGTLIGVAFGLLVCGLIPLIDFRIDAELYYLDALGVRIDLFQVLSIVFTALAISWLATIYPSWQASRLSPVQGLREN